MVPLVIRWVRAFAVFGCAAYGASPSDIPSIDEIPHAEEVAKPAGHIIKGLTEGFVGHSVTETQRECLARGASGAVADVTGTSVDTVHKLQSIFGDVKDVAQEVYSLSHKDSSFPSAGPGPGMMAAVQPAPMMAAAQPAPMMAAAQPAPMPMYGAVPQAPMPGAAPTRRMMPAAQPVTLPMPVQPGTAPPAARLPPVVDASGNFQIPKGGFSPAWGAPPGGLPHWAERTPGEGIFGTTENAVTTVETARLTALELSHSLQDMFQMEHGLASKCLNGDSFKLMQLAKTHLNNMTYVGGHLVANGAEVIHSLAGAVTAYDKNDMEKFGLDIGTAWREVLVSKAGSSTSLVEHMEDFVANLQPSKLVKSLDEEEMTRVTEGMVSSLFGSGFSVEVLAPGAGEISTTPAGGGWLPPDDDFLYGDKKGMMKFKIPEKYRMATNDTEVNINLHECISGNQELFHDAYKPVVGLSEQFMEGHCTGAVRSLCMSLWTTVLGDMQTALKTCGFSEDQERVLLHALWAGKMFHGNLSIAEQDVRAKDLTVTMANAVEDYEDNRYKRFGEQLGFLMKDMIVVSFPQEYTRDKDGRLRRLLRELEEEVRPTRSVTVLASASLVFAVMLTAAVARVRRSVHAPALLSVEMEQSDPEAAIIE